MSQFWESILHELPSPSIRFYNADGNSTSSLSLPSYQLSLSLPPSYMLPPTSLRPALSLPPSYMLPLTCSRPALCPLPSYMLHPTSPTPALSLLPSYLLPPTSLTPSPVLSCSQFTTQSNKIMAHRPKIIHFCP